jgi:hypothetical protein
VAEAAEREPAFVRDFVAFEVEELYGAEDEVRAVIARRDRDVVVGFGHG